jgi:predicted MPP superfamily phosphohydrolase
MIIYQKMFHTIITLSYIIPSVYLFIRFWQFYVEKKHRLWYVVTFAFLFLLYPVSGLFDDRAAGGFGNIIVTISNHLLPLFLYLFLSVLIADLLMLINLVAKVIPIEKLKVRSVRNRMMILIMSFSFTVVIAGVINFNTIRVTEKQIVVQGKSSDIDNLRIAFVSDFHVEEKTPVGFVERFVKKIGTLSPDLLLYGGDIMEGFSEAEKMEKFEKLLSSIKTGYGVYGVLGNHDRAYLNDTSNFYFRSGINILKDTIIGSGRSFVLAGRNDSRDERRKSAEDLLRDAPENLPLIVLDHRPTEIEQLSETSADIVFSGHTHHGQLFPINLITKKVYELSYGNIKKEKTHFFVSSGIRLWGPPVRTVGKSEILIVNIKFSK